MRSSIEALRQAQSSMDAPKQQAEELATRFQGMGADSLATGAEGLRNGVEQAQGMVPDVVTHLEQLITEAQGLKTTNPAGLPGASTTHTRPPPTPLDAAPPDLKEPTTKIGDPVTAPAPKPGPFRAELTDHDADDTTRSKIAKFGRRLSRNVGELKEAGADITDSAASTIRDDYDPHAPGTTEAIVGVPSSPPQITPAGHETKASEYVGTSIVMAVLAVEGIARLIRKKDYGR